MGTRYVVPYPKTSHTTAGDLVVLTAGTDRNVRLCEVKLSVAGNAADVGDAQQEQLEISVFAAEGTFTAATGGTTPTPRQLSPWVDTPSEASARVNPTADTAVGTGTLTEVFPDAANVHGGYHYLPVPEHIAGVIGTDAWVVKLNEAPADGIEIIGYVIYEEL